MLKLLLKNFYYLLFLLIFFSSCEEDNPINILPIQPAYPPMWPQVGYDGRHSGNPNIPKVNQIPVQGNSIDWIDTIPNLNNLPRSITCIDSKGDIYFLENYADGSLYKIRSDGLIIWKVDTTNIPAFAGVSLSDDELRIYYSNGVNFNCRDTSGQLIWSIPNGSGSKAAIGKDGIIYTKINGFMSAVSKDGILLWQNSAVDNRSHAALDTDDNIYFVSNGNVLKLNKNGEMIWSYSANAIDQVLIDGFNNLYFLNEVPFDYSLTSLSKDGILRWELDTITNFSTPAISRDNIIFTTRNKYIYAVDTSGTVQWRSLLLPEGLAEHIEPYLILDDEDNIYYLTQTSGFSTVASMSKDGGLRWFLKTVLDPILAGPVLSPLGKIIFQPKRMNCIVSVK